MLSVALFAGLLGAASPASAGVDPYIGEIMTTAISFCPVAWLATQGQILRINEHAALYSLLGNRFGGDGKTTFALPNIPNTPDTQNGALIHCIAVRGYYPPRPW
jgi:microcystin-dependent protein